MTENNNHLQYVLSALNSSAGLPKLCMQMFFKSDGKVTRLLSPTIAFESIPQFPLTDQQFLQWLKFFYEQQLLNETPGHALILQDEWGAEILQVLIASKRCHWLSVQNPPLRIAETREAYLEWEALEDGLKKLRCHLIGQQNIIFQLNPFWYLDQRDWQCGIVQLNIPPMVVNKLLATPAMTDTQIKTLYAALGKGSAAQKKSPIRKTASGPIELLPQLSLSLLPILVDHPYEVGQYITLKIPVVELLFNYGGHVIQAFASPKETRKIERDAAAEISALSLLEAQGLVSLQATTFRPVKPTHEHAYFVLPKEDASDWLAFNLEKLPLFRTLNWQVVTSVDYPYQFIDQSDVEWYTELEAGGNQKWFDVELGITVHGEKINLLPLLVAAIDNFFVAHHKEARVLPTEGHLLAKLPDGRLLPMPIARLRPILAVLTELFDRHNLNEHGKIRLSRIRAAQLVALEKTVQAQLKMRWWGSGELETLAERLQHLTEIETVLPPKGLQAVLRPYQQEGLNWLQFLRTYALGGVLADDMGLGKTIQTLAHILLEKESGRMTHPCLVVTPTTLVTNWQLEAKKYCPNLRVLVLHGVTRQELFKTIDDYDLVLTTYPLIVRDCEMLQQKKFYLIALDEAQLIKNARSKASLFVNKLHAEHRLCLTGTPLENHLGELWSLFHFLMPGLLGDAKQFTRLFRVPIERHQTEDRRHALRERLAPFVLRRTKKSVALELPEKSEIVSVIEFDVEQSDLYESVRLSLHESVQLAVEKKGLVHAQLIILDALLKLRQICCDPRLLKLKNVNTTDVGSAKLNYLCETLPNMIEEGRKILLFSQFTEMLGLIEEALTKLNIPYVTLTGQTQDRMAPINAFQNGAVPLFLISLKAGGLGLNLTAADTVIHYDPWWNPAVERQATDRAHRIGQNKSVFVYKLIIARSIEEKILALQQKKQHLLDILDVDDQTGSKKITSEDLQQILSCI